MRARRLIQLALFFGLAAYAPGCAQGGGGDPDAGTIVPRPDAGPPRMDAFVPPVDAGPGPDPVDAGTPVDAGADAGSRIDAGTDAGTPIDAGTDAGPPPACGESPCRLAPPQCGCASGQACYPTSGGRECAMEGTTPEGVACSNNSDCAEGFICASGGCRRMCLTDGDCPGRGSECAYSVTVGPNTLKVCSQACEPAARAGANGCMGGQACRYESSGGRYFTDCVAAGTKDDGADCFDDEECRAGSICLFTSLDPSAPGACTESCNLDGAGGDCFFCIAFFNSTPTIEGEEYGFCGD